MINLLPELQKKVVDLIFTMLTVYASAHNRNGMQVDSVKSNIIPIIKAGQEVAFTAKPYPGVKFFGDILL
jgi:hypothetical protein